MTTERERIEKLLADGKVSPMEAERLRAALEKAERDEREKAARPGAADGDGADRLDKIGRPRTSRLALAGVLGLPAAGVTFLFVMGLAIVFGAHGDRAVAGGLLMAVAVALVGVGLSIAGLVVTRRQPDRFSGRRLATAGIIAPVVAAILGGTGLAIVVYQHEKRSEALAREMEREMERRNSESIRAMKEEEARRREEDKRLREEEGRRQEESRAAKQRAAESRRRAAGRVTVTVSRDGRLAVEGEGKGGGGARAVELAALAEELRALVEACGKLVVEIRADPATPYDKVTTLMDALVKAGVTDVSLRTE